MFYVHLSQFLTFRNKYFLFSSINMSHQEEGSALLDATSESVADGVGAQVRPVVSDSDDDGGTPSLGTTRLSEVDADQLNHVRLQEIDIPDVKKK